MANTHLYAITTNFSVQKAYLTNKCNGTEEKEDSAVCPKEVLPDQKESTSGVLTSSGQNFMGNY